MSDLQCPATIIVARHGEAEYEDSLLVDRGGSLTIRGRHQAKALGESLIDRAVSVVYSSGMARAVQTAEIVACTLGVTVRVRDALREFSVGDFGGQPFRTGPDDPLGLVWRDWEVGDLSVGCPGAESGQDVVERMTGELETIADLHRGETVLIVSHGGAMWLTLPRLASNVADSFASPGHRMGFCQTVELAVDADGWALVSWPDRDIPRRLPR